MAADVAREGELLEELLHPLGILALVGIDLGVRSLKVAGGQDTRSAMTGAGHEDDVQVVALDHAVQVRPDERKRWARAPADCLAGRSCRRPGSCKHTTTHACGRAPLHRVAPFRRRWR